MKHANDYNLRLVRLIIRNMKEGINTMRSDMPFFEKQARILKKDNIYRKLSFILKNRGKPVNDQSKTYIIPVGDGDISRIMKAINEYDGKIDCHVL